MEKLNNKNDSLIKTTNFTGADISSQRIDILDQKSLKYAVEITTKNNAIAIDLGCGLGSQGIRFANIGINTILIDQLNIKDTITNIIKSTPHLNNQNLKYINKNIKNLRKNDLPNNINIVYSQRFIHYLTYSESKKLLYLLHDKMNENGKIYISASGINSELSNKYKHKNKLIEKRYCKLDSKIAEKHNIKSPVCLYSKNELKKLLEK